MLGLNIKRGPIQWGLDIFIVPIPVEKIVEYCPTLFEKNVHLGVAASQSTLMEGLTLVLSVGTIPS